MLDHPLVMFAFVGLAISTNLAAAVVTPVTTLKLVDVKIVVIAEVRFATCNAAMVVYLDISFWSVSISGPTVPEMPVARAMASLLALHPTGRVDDLGVPPAMTLLMCLSRRLQGTISRIHTVLRVFYKGRGGLIRKCHFRPQRQTTSKSLIRDCRAYAK